MIYALTGDLRGGQQHRVQVGAERTDVFHRRLVAADEPVVAEHRRNRDGQAERGHDQRLAHRARHLVDRRLSGDADRGQRMVDAPHRAEEADERRGGADGGEEREAVLRAALHVVDRALDRHRYPFVEVDVAEQTGVLGRRLEPRFGDEAVGARLLQPVGAFAHGGRRPERLVRRLRLAAHLELLVHLGDDHVPAAHRHDDQDAERDPGDDVAALPQRFEPVGVLDGLGRLGAVGGLRRRRGAARCGRGGGRRRCSGLGLRHRDGRDDGASDGNEQNRGQRGRAGHLQHVVSRQMVIQSKFLARGPACCAV